MAQGAVHGVFKARQHVAAHFEHDDRRGKYGGQQKVATQGRGLRRPRRKRIGRGAAKSYCVLMTGGKVTVNQTDADIEAFVRPGDRQNPVAPLVWLAS